MSSDLGVAIPLNGQIRDVDTWATTQADDLAPGVPILIATVGRTVVPIGQIGFHVAE